MADDQDPNARNEEDVGSPDLSTHPLVEKLNPDGGTPPGRVPLIGFIGPSKKDGYIRVYRDLQFRSYYEVPRDAVHHTIPVNRDDPDSPTKVLVPANTPIEMVEVTTHHVEAGFVAGNIAQGRLGFTTPPSSLPSPICTTAITCPSGCPQQCTGVTTIVTCNVTCPVEAASPICTTAITCPSGCHPCTGVTTVITCNVTCPEAQGTNAAAQAAVCTTAITCPSGCPQQCTGPTTFVTCPPLQQAAAPAQHTIICTTLYTCPTGCHPCNGPTTYVTCPGAPAAAAAQGGGAQAAGGANACTGITTYVTCPPQPCVGITTYYTCNVTNPQICHQAGAQAPAAAAAPTPLCITLYTHYPTWCPPICLTVTTAVPTACGPQTS